MNRIMINEKLGLLIDLRSIYNNKLDVAGHVYQNIEYNRRDFIAKTRELIETEAHKQMEQFIKENLSNIEYLKINEYRLSYLIQKQEKNNFNLDLDYRYIEKGLIDLKSVVYDIYTNEYYIEKWENNKLQKVTDFINLVYTHYVKYGILLKKQLESGIAPKAFIKAQKIEKFLEGKKTVKLIFNDKELSLKDHNVSINWLFEIDDHLKLKFTRHRFNENITDTTPIIIKHGRKAIKFTFFDDKEVEYI